MNPADIGGDGRAAPGRGFRRGLGHWRPADYLRPVATRVRYAVLPCPAAGQPSEPAGGLRAAFARRRIPGPRAGPDGPAAIGTGERTFTNIARAAGGIANSTLTRAADLLIGKGVVAGDLPVSLSPSKERRYRITDSYMRFWLAFLGPHLAEIDRMRWDLTLVRIERTWTTGAAAPSSR